MLEIWRTSPLLPEYQGSSLGRVRCIPYKALMPHGGFRTYGGLEHHGQDGGEGRLILVYKGKTYKVARIICAAFKGVPPKGKNICMHLDENYKNNNPKNLEWGTQKENLNAPKFLAYCHGRTGENSPRVKGNKL